MIQVSIEYKPFMRRRPVVIETGIPSKWSELNAAQFLFIMSRDAWMKGEDVILKLFLNVNASLVRRMDDYQKFSIVRQLKALNSSIYCDRFLIPELGRLKAPQPRLKGVTFGAFVFGDSYFESYINGRADDLERFIACYYLDGEFDDDGIERRAAIIRRLPMETRVAIFQNYALIREWLAKSYRYVFQKGEGKKKQTGGGWVAVFDMLCGDSPEKYREIERMPLSQALRFLNNKTKEHQKYGRRIR